MVKPAEMTKVSVTGSKNQLQTVIDTLYQLEILDIEEYDGELETGEPFEEAEELSQMLVDVRSLLSKLPQVETGQEEFRLEELQQSLDEIAEQVEEVEDMKSEIENELAGLEEQQSFFRKLQGSGLTYEDLNGTESLEVFIGRIDTEAFKERADASYELAHGEDADIVFYREKDAEHFEEVLRHVRQEEFSVSETSFSGTAEEILENIQDRREQLEQERESIDQEFEELSVKWRGRLENAEGFLTEKVEKSEAPIKFATTKRTFIAEGWVPAESVSQMEQELEARADGKVHVETEEGDNPPVKHENNRLVKPFESLTDLVAVPRYNELDPSFMIFLTFPIMFGFMIGDAGYGLTALAVFYAGYRMFPKAKDIFKSLMYASVATIIFGLAFGDAFGYILFGHHSELDHILGTHIFSHIPILFHRAEHLGTVFQIAALFGLFHVNLGYLLGAYNEYVNHGIKEAFLEKGSWILLEIGALLWFLFGLTAGAPVLVIAVVTLYLGEGVEGVVEIPSLLSNVLSYLRIFGVSVAAVALAGVVNAMAEPLFAMHSTAGLIGGIAVLMVGHFFNTFIKIMEGFLQGIRLHYVELFTKFFEGGGRKYSPFGSQEFR